jgi:dTMP kinase
MTRGRFITFEGTEACGKSTQYERVMVALRERGYEIISSREPGGTRTGELIRDVLQHNASGEDICPETEVLLFAASRAQLVRNVIVPALDAGTWVICDRFMDSTTAYQGYGRGFDVEKMIEINAFAVGDTVPDLTILLDVDVDTSLARMQARVQSTGEQLDRFERETREFHDRVRVGYRALAERWPERFRVIDSSVDVDDVAAEIWRSIEPLMSESA